MDRSTVLASRARDSRVLIVSNLLNGQTDWKVAQAFRVDVKDVKATFDYVMRKLREYLFRQCKPPIMCDTLENAKKDRVNILAILPKLNLDKEPEYKNIVNETVSTNNYKSAMHDLRR